MAASPTRCASISNGWKAKSSNTKIPRRSSNTCDGILVPGGFGQRGAEGKIRAAQFARERRVPYFGICFGMQMAVIEAARNLCGIDQANSTEFGPTKEPIVGLMTEVDQRQRVAEARQRQRLGRHHAAGAYPAHLRRGSHISGIYSSAKIFPNATGTATKSTRPTRIASNSTVCGLPACRPMACCPKSVEYEDHPWFIGVQYHPGAQVTPVRKAAPAILVVVRLVAAVEQSRLVQPNCVGIFSIQFGANRGASDKTIRAENFPEVPQAYKDDARRPDPSHRWGLVQPDCFQACELLRHGVTPRIVEHVTLPHHETSRTALPRSVKRLDHQDRGGLIDAVCACLRTHKLEFSF